MRRVDKIQAWRADPEYQGPDRDFSVNAMINGGASWIDYILTAAALAAAVYALWLYKNIER
jgi:hypothetical protein